VAGLIGAANFLGRQALALQQASNGPLGACALIAGSINQGASGKARRRTVSWRIVGTPPYGAIIRNARGPNGSANSDDSAGGPSGRASNDATTVAACSRLHVGTDSGFIPGLSRQNELKQRPAFSV
jgi:hypothetical protein